MGSIKIVTMLEHNEATVHVELNCNKNKQKLMIHALLMCSELSMELMASILEVSVTMLKDVYKGIQYFKTEQAIKLMQLFLIRFTDGITFI